MEATFYMPLTAAPFRKNEVYKEVLPKNPELAKYIRCFWGSDSPYFIKEKRNAGDIVVPDTCADIIYHIDHTDHTITGGFCGINDAAFSDCHKEETGHLVSVFAIRFYAWGVYAFSEDSLKETINGYFDVQSRFWWLDHLLRSQLLEKSTLEERIKTAETMFVRKLPGIKQHRVIDKAVHHIIRNKGRQSAVELAGECFVSSRQLQRLFHEYIGITPKKLSNLIRYQYLWNEIITDTQFDIQDAVYRYGFTDQSHLLREFKRYHTMDIQTAKNYAHKDDQNIQYR